MECITFLIDISIINLNNLTITRSEISNFPDSVHHFATKESLKRENKVDYPFTTDRNRALF